jgi:hypothetical protein
MLLQFLHIYIYTYIYVYIKEPRNKPGVDQRVPGSLGSHISWRSTREGCEFVSLTHRPPLPQEIFLILIFTRGWVDPRVMVRLEGNMSLKFSVTPPGIDPGTSDYYFSALTTTPPQAPYIYIYIYIYIHIHISHRTDGIRITFACK